MSCAETRVGSPDFLAEVLAHVEAHRDAPLTVAKLANVAGLSPYHFSRVFTARFGMSVMSYVRDCRLQGAALKLAGEAPPSLTELAFECGYESQEAFTRAFHERPDEACDSYVKQRHYCEWIPVGLAVRAEVPKIVDGVTQWPKQ